MKILLITGASAGIGLHTAQRFVADGYAVVNLSRRRCPIDAVSQINCDLSVPGFIDNISNQLSGMLQEAEQVVLVHNAARMGNDTAVETPSVALREALEVNVVAPNTLNYFTIPYMKPGSAIIYVGSTLAEKAVLRWAPGAVLMPWTGHTDCHINLYHLIRNRFYRVDNNET